MDRSTTDGILVHRCAYLNQPVTATTTPETVYPAQIALVEFIGEGSPTLASIQPEHEMLPNDFPLEGSSSHGPRAVKAKGRAVWSPDVEKAFEEAMERYPTGGRMKIRHENGKMYGRNELVAMYIECKTGMKMHRKHVSSHIQVLQRRRNRELVAREAANSTMMNGLDGVWGMPSTSGTAGTPGHYGSSTAYPCEHPASTSGQQCVSQPPQVPASTSPSWTSFSNSTMSSWDTYGVWSHSAEGCSQVQPQGQYAAPGNQQRYAPYEYHGMPTLEDQRQAAYGSQSTAVVYEQTYDWGPAVAPYPVQEG